MSKGGMEESRNKNFMSCQWLVIGPDAANNLIVLSTQQKLCECHDRYIASALVVRY